MIIPICEECGIDAEHDAKHGRWICPKCGAWSPCVPGKLDPAALPLRGDAENAYYDFVSNAVKRLVQRKVENTGQTYDECKDAAMRWLSEAVAADLVTPLRRWPLDALRRAARAIAPYTTDKFPGP